MHIPVKDVERLELEYSQVRIHWHDAKEFQQVLEEGKAFELGKRSTCVYGATTLTSMQPDTAGTLTASGATLAAHFSTPTQTYCCSAMAP